MSDETCVFHPGQLAVAACDRCGKSFCSVCLVSTPGTVLCRSCSESPKPASLDDLDRLLKKPSGADDDPLGLFGTKTQVGTPVPAPVPPKPMTPSPTPEATVPAPVPEPPAPKPITPPPPAPVPGIPVEASPGIVKPAGDAVPLRAVPGFGYDQPRRDASALTAFWWKVEKALAGPAKALHIPVPILAGSGAFLIAVLIAAPLLWFGLRRPSVPILDQVTPIHVVKVQVSQVGELDIAAYLEIEGKLLGLGFSPLIQLTLPQAPSPNFVATFIKEGAGVYAEILKMPGTTTPKVSFLTVFNNGVWCSTNGFPGKDAQSEYLLSTHHPNDASDALYVKHIQKVDQLKKQQGWVPARMGESRYVAALTDHLRWYLSWKKIPGYKAAFDLWH